MLAVIVAGLGAGCEGDLSDDPALLGLEDVASGGALLDAGLAEASDDGGAARDAGPGPDAAVTPSAPRVPYIVSVKANGTGCPAGTWNTAVAPDGQTFTTTFSAYEVELNKTQRLAVKDCLLSLAFSSPSNLSYAVTGFSVAGYAFLEPGLTGIQTSNYYFQGTPVAAAGDKRTQLTGPVDRSYLFNDVIRPADAVWSPCGKDRLLQILTRIQLRRESGTGEGYMNIIAVGRVASKLVFKLSWRQC